VRGPGPERLVLLPDDRHAFASVHGEAVAAVPSDGSTTEAEADVTTMFRRFRWKVGDLVRVAADELDTVGIRLTEDRRTIHVVADTHRDAWLDALEQTDSPVHDHGDAPNPWRFQPGCPACPGPDLRVLDHEGEGIPAPERFGGDPSMTVTEAQRLSYLGRAFGEPQPGDPEIGSHMTADEAREWLETRNRWFAGLGCPVCGSKAEGHTCAKTV
jgi:hypothetical protein